MRRTSAILTGILLLAALPMASAGNADDAGSGRDAPADRADALPIGLGTHAGNLAPLAGDRTDWFLLTFAPGSTVRLRLDAAENAAILWLRAEDADGYVEASGSTNFFTGVDELAGSTTGRLFVRVSTNGDDSGSYTLVAEDAGPGADFVVTRLDVRPQRAGAGPGHEMFRLVDVRVENRGHAPASTTLAVAVHHPDRTVRGIAYATLTLAPGESFEASYEWERVGEIGDGEVVASAFVAGDLRSRDNAARTNEETLVAIGGVGSDVLAKDLSLGAAGVTGARVASWHSEGAHHVASEASAPFLIVGYDARDGNGEARADAAVPVPAQDLHHEIEEILRR